LYGTAERCPQGVTIYLVPGLTGRQRKAVIRRLRQEASRGCGPELPLLGLLVALGADRVRVAIMLTAAAVRLHPAVTLLPTAFVATAMMLFVITSAGVRPVPAVAGARPGISKQGPTVGVRNGGVGSGATVGFNSADAYYVSLAAGGRGLGSGHPARAGGRGRLRVARVCFGAMPGVAARRTPLACRRTRSSAASGSHRAG
jgi:hypothetical protein